MTSETYNNNVHISTTENCTELVNRGEFYKCTVYFSEKSCLESASQIGFINTFKSVIQSAADIFASPLVIIHFTDKVDSVRPFL